MELTAEEPGVPLQFHDLDQFAVRGYPADHESRGLQCVPIAVVELIAMAMAFEDVVRSVGLVRQGPLLYLAGIGAQPHAAALVAREVPLLHGLAPIIIPM